MGDVILLESDEEVKGLLESIYRIASEIVFSIYSVNRDFASRVGESLKKYEFGHLTESFQSSADAVSRLALFFEDYVDGIIKGLEFFYNLVLSLGVKDYSGIISQKNNLENIIKIDTIDLDFLKFQMRAIEELIYPQFERITANTIEKLDRLREVSTILKSDASIHLLKRLKNRKTIGIKFKTK